MGKYVLLWVTVSLVVMMSLALFEVTFLRFLLLTIFVSLICCYFLWRWDKMECDRCQEDNSQRLFISRVPRRRRCLECGNVFDPPSVGILDWLKAIWQSWEADKIRAEWQRVKKRFRRAPPPDGPKGPSKFTIVK